MKDTATTTSEGGPPTGAAAQKGTGLGVIFLTVFIDLMGFSLIFPLFPAILEHYIAVDGKTGLLGRLLDLLRDATSASTGDPELYVAVLFGGVLGSLYALLSFFFAPFWGRMSDRIGRRRVLLFTVTGTALSYVVWFFSGSFWILVVSRLVGGVMSGNISVANAAIADVTTPATRAKGMGALGAAFGLGFILGPAIGGGLAQFDLSTVLPIPGVNPFSMAALGALILSTVNLVWVVRRFKETLSPENVGKASSAARPINPIKAMIHVDVPHVNPTNLVYFIYTLAFTGMEFTLTFLARDRFQYTPGKNALLFVFVGFIIAFVQGGLVRRLAPRFGEKKLTLAGFALVVPGLIMTGLATTELMLYAGLGTLSVGSALATPSLTSLVSLYSPSHRQGEILGVFRSLGSLARAIGPLVAATIYWRFGSAWPYFGAALVMLVPFVMMFPLPPPVRHVDDTPVH